MIHNNLLPQKPNSIFYYGVTVLVASPEVPPD